MNARLSTSVIVSVISCASGSRDDGRTAAPRRTPCFANLQMQPCLRVHDHPGITACPTDMTHALARVRLSSGAIVSGKTGEPLLIPDRLRRHLAIQCLCRLYILRRWVRPDRSFGDGRLGHRSCVSVRFSRCRRRKNNERLCEVRRLRVGQCD
jgi:hypothetical protein